MSKLFYSVVVILLCVSKSFAQDADGCKFILFFHVCLIIISVNAHKIITSSTFLIQKVKIKVWKAILHISGMCSMCITLFSGTYFAIRVVQTFTLFEC